MISIESTPFGKNHWVPFVKNPPTPNKVVVFVLFRLSYYLFFFFHV
jgi:hypothetical protein